MALNKIFASTEERHRSRTLASITAPSTPPTTIQPGTPVLFPDGGAVALTASANGTKTQTNPVPGVTTITYTNAGVGVPAGEAVFAFDGTWDFAVTSAGTSTAAGAPVYIILASGALTLTASTNTLFGYTDYPVGYVKESGRAAVRIGK